ncbi:UDP-N-acetylmuramoyl-tripeptide--D-alanyl-D-alanine ligase [Leminorella grimontii]|uniref:UDP-N-acetylmuramoyl-tripeptide--D-alanyl-D-alanine ligase n=1 Tax=Leminorella grimontii TaxID=82981 RepID=A0AAV5N2C2_9GAMM|nr:UDP-N-acetylmuramoyl-tripeptide--D-alanyl-D-alanine ligase [Leminorella grimontii]KFC95130.1 UDP-N-acetylmuramoylalanyl-D-glutamyl-2,6-diaminopimelate--D-alanyl-D-alanine ligase [Leminorella grimontii ATCC 33999 = DSM 5078]GKX56271.1 UDP-N-acetylmuramoyl-tripeptide--D-alanyl-D-alanine ligase [Leminorella grimontii]VFS60840.1 UDP-N-acetylmuramoyl-tripeptide--D-alanyl-D-alanine ligase [Leminorella grimontii]
MIPATLTQLAQAVDGRLIAGTQDIIGRQFTAVTTDTRKVEDGCLFIALKGERFDAHDFAAEAIKGGAAALVVDRHLPLDVAQIVVQDTRIALGRLGAWVRQQVPARVVALTGSSGKTSVKEMSAAILQQCGEVLYTAGNLNNDIGAPLTLLRLTKSHRFAVIELGANHAGEIAYTVNLAQPETALVNNLAAAHLEGFGSLAGVAKAKGEIFGGLPPEGVAIVNADSNDLKGWQNALADKRVWLFSAKQTEGIDFYATNVVANPLGSQFLMHTPLGNVAVTLPLPGPHNVANALAAAALALSVGATLDAVRAGLATLGAVPGRLFPIPLGEGKLLLDDSYNANVGSMTAAAHTLAAMPGYRVMVVGDMGELGDDAVDCHRQVGEAARLAGVDKVLSVGALSETISTASGRGEHFHDKEAVAERLKQLLSEHAVITILVKGSRSSAMEQVVHRVQETVQC